MSLLWLSSSVIFKEASVRGRKPADMKVLDSPRPKKGILSRVSAVLMVGIPRGGAHGHTS